MQHIITHYDLLMCKISQCILTHSDLESKEHCCMTKKYNMRKAMGKNIDLTSKITCPKCQHKKVETMPTNACQWFYECECCHALIKPKPGDCCVFCSYGSIKCPPKQANNSCC